MEGNPISEELSSFLHSGIYNLDRSRVIFVDPVRILNHSYSRFRISPSAYYSRSLESAKKEGSTEDHAVSPNSKKRKKRKRKSRDLNEREVSAERRHQELRPLLLEAQSAFLRAADLLSFLPNIVKSEEGLSNDGRLGENHNFIELGKLWQAPFYEISLCFGGEGKGDLINLAVEQNGGRTMVPLFTSLVNIETDDDVEAEFLNSHYILPSRSCFYMSDLRSIHDLIPAQSDHGFNLIVIDPPWENGSAYQKAVYPTLPNRYFLYLPVKQLAHTEGALVVLWMTNREKLHLFVEKELFPAWGVTNVTTSYWLKVKPDGSLIGELDLFHHRPYECFLAGYVNVKSADSESPALFKYLESSRVFISIPGAHSRKPSLGRLLSDHIPGRRPAKCIELFARELIGGWTSWGNEPLRFQESSYFSETVSSDRAR